MTASNHNLHGDVYATSGLPFPTQGYIWLDWLCKSVPTANIQNKKLGGTVLPIPNTMILDIFLWNVGQFLLFDLLF